MAEKDWEKEIEAGKKALQERVGNGKSRRDNAACAFVGDPDRAIFATASVCHSFLCGHEAKFVINSLQTGEDYGENPGRILSKEVELWFVDYILNRSPYAVTFVSKDAEKALEEQMTVSSGDHPGNLMGAGIVALRRLWEHVYVARAAHDLAKLGVNEDLAFLIGHCIQSPSKINNDTIVTWDNNLNWHTSVDIGLMGAKSMRKFLDHEVVSPGPIYSKSGTYRNYSGMFTVGGDGTHLGSLIEVTFPYIKYQDNPAAISGTNPFTASLPKALKVDRRSAPYSKAIEVMAEWANTYLMEKINNA